MRRRSSQYRKYIQRVLNSSKRRRYLDPLHEIANLEQCLASECEAFFAGRVLIGYSLHSLQHGFGNNDSRHLVRQEFRVAIRDQRPDSGYDWNSEALDSLQESPQLLGIERRLCDRIFRARFHLPFESPEFVFQVHGAWIDANAYIERCGLADWISSDIKTVIQPVDHIRQTDRIDVEDRGSIRIRPHLRRIAGYDQEVCDAEADGAPQVARHPEQVSIAAAVMGHAFISDLRPNHFGDCNKAIPRLAPRPVRTFAPATPALLRS